SPSAARAVVAPGGFPNGVRRRAVVVDLARRKVLARRATGAGPGWAAWSPDGVRIYVSDAARGSVAVLSGITGARLRTVLVAGGPGNAPLTMGPGDDCADGGPSNDTIDGGPGNDTLDGGDADDTVRGGEGDDTIVEHGLGNDVLLNGGPGNDYVDGGRGNDRE